MKRDFQGHSKKGGVYKITNLKNGKIYIGSAKEFKRRASQHASSLRNNKHQNKHLQASFWKHGEDNFLFEVLEVVDGNKGERFKIEQKWIDKLIKEGKWEQTFNFKKKTVQKERSCFSKTPEETKKKMSKSQRGRKLSEETKRKIGLAHKGKEISLAQRKILSKSTTSWWNNKLFRQNVIDKRTGSKHSEETKKRMRASQKNSWQDETRRINLSNTIRKLWDSGDHRKKICKQYKLLSPAGRIIHVTDMPKFCQENGLNYSTMRVMLTGRCKTYKGYQLAT